MKLILFNIECWIKSDAILSLDFDFMNNEQRWDYIHHNNLFHKEEGPAVISVGYKEWYLNGKEA